MIIDLTSRYVPESYTDSRDFRVLLRQLSLLLTTFKYNIDNLPDLYYSDNCPDNLLPLLASMVGFSYNEDKSVSDNRKIVKNYPYLLRNRGSDIGIRLAMALSINTSNTDKVYSVNDILISTDAENGVITVYYPEDVNDFDMSLLEAVRPVGMMMKFVRADIGTMTDEFELQVNVRGIRHDYRYDISGNDSVAGYDINN